ncbi:MAG: PAS domain S-box protein, partial [Desulfobaccales bacterium]
MDITERQRAEETLRKSEQKYRLLVNQIPAVLFKGYADGSMDFFDDKVEGLTGYPKEDFDSRTLKWTNLIVPEDRKECRSKFLEALRTNRSFMREYRIRRKDGALRWIQGRAQIFCDEAGRIDYVSGVLFDITERKLAEREILRFASFPRLNPNPVLEIDLVGKVTYANEYAYEVLRKLGRQDITGFLPSDLEDLIQSYREQGVKRFFREIELEGAVFAESIHVVEEFKMLRLFAVDITKHKQAEESLRDNQQFLTDIFNSIQDGMIILSLDFTIIRVNPALEKLPFVKPMVGRKCYEILHNRSEPCEECVAREVIQTGLAAEKIITVKADDRSTIFLEIHAFPLLNRTTGQVDQVIEFARNITNRKRAEEESLRFSKLESLSTLAGGIAHDFNNILTAILGNIGLAMLDQDMGDQGRQRLAAAEKACQQAQRLARQLLTFAKGGAPIKKIVSIAKLLKESASLILSGSKSRCNFSIPDDLWSVQADAGQINQVINNLLINADYAMPEGGVIEITAENILVERESKLPISKGQYVKFAIADRGIGISRKYLHKIFD